MDVNLGLDISTSIIGWSVLDPASSILTYPLMKGHIDFRKVKGGFWGKVDEMGKQIAGLRMAITAAGHTVTTVFVEDPLKKFARGKSSADTISILARFNALTSYVARTVFGVDPLYIDATVARKRIGVPLLSRKKSGGLSQKEQTFNFLCRGVFLNEQWSLNRNGKIQPYHADEVDAYVIGVAGCMGLGNPA